jgi:hypothetical protein
MVIGGAMQALIAGYDLHVQTNPRNGISIDRSQSRSIGADPRIVLSKNAKQKIAGLGG